MKHVLILPLKASTCELERAQFLMRMSGQVYNATLQTMIGRVQQVRRDKTWRELAGQKPSEERTTTYNELKTKYGLSEFDCNKVALAHIRDSVWLADHLDGRIAIALGKEVWVSISKWMYGKSGKPHYIKSRKRRMLSGNDQRAGLRYKNGYIIHSTAPINKAKGVMTK